MTRILIREIAHEAEIAREAFPAGTPERADIEVLLQFGGDMLTEQTVLTILRRLNDTGVLWRQA